METTTQTLYHNVEQNHHVPCSDDIADRIVERGFTSVAWLSTRPLASCGPFTGLTVTVPLEFDIEGYREDGDAIEDLGVRVYAVPAEVANTWPRGRCYPAPGDIVET